MDEEVEQINVEPEFPFNPFEDCDEGNLQKIDTSTDNALNLFTYTKSGKKQSDNNTKKCIYCDKFYRKKYMATHLRVRTMNCHAGRSKRHYFNRNFLQPPSSFRHIPEKNQ